MAETHDYRVEGTRTSRYADQDWELVPETTDPTVAMDRAHNAEGYFWRRVLEDGRIDIDRM